MTTTTGCVLHLLKEVKTKYIDSFRENLDYLFSSKSIEWHLIEPIDH